VLLRGQQTSFILTLLAALSFLGMLALFILGTTGQQKQGRRSASTQAQ
jgi:hypothetical protein